MWRDHLLQRHEQLLLGVEPLGDGFDHQIAIAQLCQGLAHLQVALRLGTLLGTKPPLAHQRIEHRRQALKACLGGRRTGVVKHHTEPGLGTDLGDTATHRAGSDDADPLYFSHFTPP
ncbi:hypothetical protein D3C76_1451250 [compost metagenome]